MCKKPTMCLVLMAAGSASRFNKLLPFEKKIKKQWLRIGKIPLWKKVLDDLRSLNTFDEIVIGIDADCAEYAKNFCSDEKIVVGGDTRAQTLRNILDKVESSCVFVTDVARWDIDKSVCLELLESYEKYDCVVPYLSCVDTVFYENRPINRESLKLIQTPQISKVLELKNALSKKDYTDESSAMLDNGYSVGFVNGSNKMQKLTTLSDLKDLARKFSVSPDIVLGSGIDIHQFEDNKPMVLGGINIDSPFGFKAHSDGDVLLHALIDALLGAVGGGDIGEWFPDTQDLYKNIDSKVLLEKVRAFIVGVGYEIVHIDVSVLAQAPKISPYKKALQESLSKLLYLPKHCINIKATTAENMGFVGRKEGVCVFVNATLKFLDWKGLA